jgi:hypothetical protein
MAGQDSDKDAGNCNMAERAESQKRIKAILSKLEGKDISIRPSGTQPARDTRQHKSYKRQVDESREDFRAFLEKIYDYLPSLMEEGIRYELAADIARQLCLKMDDGEEVKEAYIRNRARRRSKEHLKN